ncbi:MAG: fatty acid hydroxylase family protein, partial [Pseudomonadota bacterium]|nr:fatty acid hydroxylase family protein [Pseudomonadota bacterium]
MTLRELVVAYFQYPAIIAYLLLSAAAIAAFAWRPAPLAPTLAAIAAASLVYPLFWYLIHRYVLHSRWMWRHKWLASTWKRIHYDHHQDPNDLEVLFGALHTTLPTIALGVI